MAPDNTNHTNGTSFFDITAAQRQIMKSVALQEGFPGLVHECTTMETDLARLGSY